jgi:hypothetical protein
VERLRADRQLLIASYLGGHGQVAVGSDKGGQS